jgi:ParB family chromosome partitioning protein
MALDLSSLEDNPIILQQDSQYLGKPLEVPVGDIVEDPHQPRTEFSKEAMKEMVESIKAKGKILSPISIRPYPDQPGKWLLNHGARRLRGSIMAGLTTIPAFIDDLHDNYDQIIENLHRENLSPMELAAFIKKRVDLGEKQKTIAKRLGKDASVITQHLALINLPDCINSIYDSGKCRSPKTLYDLKCLYEKNPDAVSKWCASEVEITRQSVANLANKITTSETIVVAIPPTSESSASVNLPQQPKEEEFSENKDEDENEGETQTRQEPQNTALKTSAANKDRTHKDEPNKTNKDCKPVLRVEINQRIAAVLLDRPPSQPHLIPIRYEDGSGDDEIAVDSCRIVSLTHV